MTEPNIAIAAQHFHIENDVQNYAKKKISEMLKKYFHNVISVDVHFTKEKHQYLCNIIVHDSLHKHHNPIVSHGFAALNDGIYMTFNVAFDKMEKKLRRYNSILKDRHHNNTHVGAKDYLIARGSEEDDMMISDQPLVTEEKSTDILTISLAEAVAKLELEHLPALLFRNPQGKMNMIYYRSDQSIKWVEEI